MILKVIQMMINTKGRMRAIYYRDGMKVEKKDQVIELRANTAKKQESFHLTNQRLRED